MFSWNELSVLAVIIGASVSSAWAVSWFLSAKLNSTNTLVYRKFEELRNMFLEKLEYHERHDDVRFDNIRKDIYQFGLRMAANTGKINGLPQEDLRS